MKRYTVRSNGRRVGNVAFVDGIYYSAVSKTNRNGFKCLGLGRGFTPRDAADKARVSFNRSVRGFYGLSRIERITVQ